MCAERRPDAGNGVRLSIGVSRQLRYQRFNGDQACRGNANFVGHRHMARVALARMGSMSTTMTKSIASSVDRRHMAHAATARSGSTSMGAVPTSAFFVDRLRRGRVLIVLTEGMKNNRPQW
jgi:hypothetical protein